MRRRSLWNVLLRLTTAAMLVLSAPGATLRADEGTTVTTPLYDTYIRQDQAGTNFGTATTMHVRSFTNVNRRSLVQFDLTTSGIPTTAAVKVSYLRLFMTVAPTASRTHTAHRINSAGPWTGTTATWNNRTTGTPWPTAGGVFNATPAAARTTGTINNVQLDWTILGDGTVANIPQTWLTTPASNLGLLIKDQTENNGVDRLAQYATQNQATAARFPMLELRYLRDVTLGAATVGISQVTWTWTFPVGSTAANYDGVMSIKKPGTGASFVFSPADGTDYAVGDNLGNNEGVVFHTLAFATVTEVDENGPDSVVLPGTAYTYKVFNHDSTVINGAASASPPHYAFGVSGNATTTTGGGALKNWSYRTGAATLSPPGLDPGNVVLAGSNDNKLHTMASTNGGRKYQPQGAIGTTGGAIQSRPVLIPSIITSVDCDTVTPLQQPCDVAYVSSGDGRVYAFDAATGAQLWRSAVLGNTIVGSAAVQVKAFSLPSYPHAFDLVIVGSRNTADTTGNSIYGLNGNTGAIVWNFTPGNLDIISSSPVLDYGTNSVWLTSRAGAAGTQPSLWKMDTATTNPAGNLLSSVTLSGLGPANPDIDASPDFDPTTAYVFAVTVGGDLVAVDHATPTNMFTTNVGAFTGMGFPIILPGSGVNDDDIYFSTSGGVHKRIFNRVTHGFTVGWDTLNATLGGTPSGPIFSPPPLAAFLYVGVSDGRLKKLNPGTGAIVLTRDVNLGTTVGDPSLDVISLKLYVGDTSGRIYSFDIF